MKKNTITYLLFFCLITTQLFSQTIYVNQNAASNGNGNSWASAYTTINEALATANANDEIWVAQGTYKETYNITTAGVQLYGGFFGFEATRTERNWNAYPTILSGDNDNSGTASTGDTANMITLNSANARFDGFIVEYTLGTTVSVSSTTPTIQNCIFRNAGGSGAYFTDDGSSATISNSLFYNLSTGSSLSLSGNITFVNTTIPADVGSITASAFGGNVNFNNCITLPSVNTGGFITINYNFTLHPTPGNLSPNAQFTDAANGDYTITNTSPAFASGNPFYATGITYDLGRNARTTPEPILMGDVINMGAYEGAGQAATTITFTPFPLTFGNPDSVLTITSNSSGVRTYELFEDMAGTIPDTSNGRSLSGISGDNVTLTIGNAGTTYLKVSIAETANNSAAEQIYELTIDKAVPSGISWTNDSQTIIVNTPLTSSVLNATSATVAGTFNYFEDYDSVNEVFSNPITPNVTSLTTIGSTTIYANFIPSDTNNYVSTAVVQRPLDVVNSLIVYVNQNATGINDGTSWTNAFTTISSAMASAVNQQEIWVAQGTYKPTAIPTSSILNLKVFGGFNGTETTRNQRDWNANPVIISGDLDNSNSRTAGDLNELLKFNSIATGGSQSNYAIEVDGFTFEYGYVSGISINTNGTTNTSIQNCVFRNFIASTTAQSIAMIDDSIGGSTDNILTLTNCLFYDNNPQNGAIELGTREHLTINNSTFYNSNIGGAVVRGSSNNKLDINNSIFQGRGANLYFERINDIVTFNITNSLFDVPYAQVYFDQITNVNITNSLPNTDALFVDTAAKDFRIQVGSPARNTGNNSLNSTSVDLDNNTRVVNGTIDMGAYEYFNSSSQNQIQTITFEPLADKLTTDADFDLTASSDSGLTVTYTSSDETVATISGNTVTIVGSGTTNITASQAGDATYAIADDVVQPLTVNKADQVISFDALTNILLTEGSFDLTATSDSGLTVTYASSDTNIATISGNTITLLAEGTVDITASQAGDDTYNAAQDVVQNLVIGKADQVITFNALNPVNVEDADFDLTATSDSGLAVTYTSSDETVATITGNTVNIISAGTTNITASQAGDNNYNAAADAVQLLTVNALVLTDQVVSVAPTSGICSVDASVTVTASQNNVNYYVRDDSNNSVIEMIAGTGNNGISFANETLTTDKTYNVVAVDAKERLNALQFDGVDGFVEIPSAINNEFSANRITVETWAYIPSSDNTDEYTSLITEEFNNGKIKYQVTIRQGQIETGFYNGAWTTTPLANYPKDEWIHIASTYDQTNMVLYINGVQVSTRVTTAALPVGNGAWRLGRRWDQPQTSSFIFGGQLADTRIWNVAKTITEINNDMNSHITNASGLVASYTFDETSGTTAVDKTGNGFDGTLTALTGDNTNWVQTTSLLEMSNTPTVTVTQVEDRTVNLTQPDTQSAIITVANSQIGVNYTLRDNADNSVIAGPIAGTGNELSFPTDIITADKTYNVYAEASSCNLQLTNTPTATYSFLVVAAKVYLQGAALNPNVDNQTFMRDDLRENSLIPTTSPYVDALTCDASVLNNGSGPSTRPINEDIVDWIYIELRDATDNTLVQNGRSALLQRDGDIVDVDGLSNLTYFLPTGNYYVAIKHRNHLGIMSSNTFALSDMVTTVDFTNATSQITFGTNAQTTFGMPADKVAMWAGNVNTDTIVQYSGTNPDTPTILSIILNEASNFLNLPTFAISGYNTNDINMDGSTQYSGTNPDTPFILQNVLAHPGNFLNFSTYQITEQLPEN